MPDKLSILYLIDELWLKGGTEKHLLELAKGMALRGHKVVVRSLWDGECGALFREEPLIDYDCLKIRKVYNFKGISELTRFYSFIKSSRFDIIQTFHTSADLVGPILARTSNTGASVISSRRDTGYTKSSRHIYAQKILNRWVDKILANSSAVKQSVLDMENVDSGKVEIIYNGINLDQFISIDEGQIHQFREQYQIPANKVFVGSVGNARPIKGYQTMVEVAAILCHKYPQLHFLHAGTCFSDVKPGLVQFCNDNGITDQFTFLGQITQIPAFLSILDIYIQPSLSEGFSNSILEAMATDLPVVATSVGGTPEMVTHGYNGYLFSPKDVTGCCECLIPLIESKVLRHELGRHAQHITIQKFSIENMIDKYESLYMRLRTVNDV